VIRAYREFVVGVRVKKLYPALKHGGYSATGLLPGEDPAAFEKLHRDLVSEHCPDGPLQEDTVFDIARRMWRKQNLETFRIAKAARERASAIRSEMIPSTTPPLDFPLFGVSSDWSPPDPADVKAATEAAEAQVRKELGENYKFVEMGDAERMLRCDAKLIYSQRQSSIGALVSYNQAISLDPERPAAMRHRLVCGLRAKQSTTALGAVA
jgi:hypothetical protein